MDRRNFLAALFGLFSIPTVCVLAKDHGNGRGKGWKKHHGDEDEDDHDNGHGHGRGHGGGRGGYFRQEHYTVIQRYYDGPRDLPPGLRKKYYRTGTLPPGWQKKMRPFPPELIRVLPPPPPNCEFGYVEGRAVVYDRRTRIIVDAIDIISAATGR